MFHRLPHQLLQYAKKIDKIVILIGYWVERQTYILKFWLSNTTYIRLENLKYHKALRIYKFIENFKKTYQTAAHMTYHSFKLQPGTGL